MRGRSSLRRRAPGGGPGPVVLEVLGRRVVVDAGGHVAAAQVEALWSRCRPAGFDADHPEVPATAGRPGDLVITLARSDRPLAPGVALRLSGQVVEAAVAAGTGRLTLLRAAAVATPDGSVLGLLGAGPAVSLSAACAELCRRGFGYVTDEVLAVRDDAEVVAFPKPLAFREGDQAPPTQAGPDALGMRACPESLRLRGLVLLRPEPGRPGPPELTRLSAAEGLEAVRSALLDASASVARGLVDGVGGVWVLRHAEIFPAAPLLVDLLARPHHSADDGRSRYVAAGLSGLPLAGGAVTARGHQVELDALRSAVWQAAAGGASVEELTIALNRGLGHRHRISPQLVAAAVRDLLALGLLVAPALPGRPGSRTRAAGTTP